MSADANPLPVTPPLPPPPVREYRAMNCVGWQAFGLIAGGGLFVLLLLGRWALLLMATNPSPANDHMPGIIGGLAVVPIFMLARGVWLLRSVVRAVVDGQGMWVEGFVARKWVPWALVQTVRRDKKSQMLGDTIELLTLLDAAGRPIVKLPDTLGYFNDLARDVAERSAAVQGRVTFDAEADAARLAALDAKKVRRGAWLAALMTLIFGFGLNEMLHLRRYATEGIRTDATIVDRYMVRVTPRLKYEFKDANGRLIEREAMMDVPAWNALAGRRTVAVEYLPSDPDWNRLVTGERKDSSLGGPFLLLSGGLTLLVGAMTVFMALGFDLNTDHGGLRLTRHGKPLGTAA